MFESSTIYGDRDSNRNLPVAASSINNKELDVENSNYPS